MPSPRDPHLSGLRHLGPARRHVTEKHRPQPGPRRTVTWVWRLGAGLGRARAKMAAAAGGPCVRCGAGRVGGGDCEARGPSRAEAGRDLRASCGRGSGAKPGQGDGRRDGRRLRPNGPRARGDLKRLLQDGAGASPPSLGAGLPRFSLSHFPSLVPPHGCVPRLPAPPPRASSSWRDAPSRRDGALRGRPGESPPPFPPRPRVPCPGDVPGLLHALVRRSVPCVAEPPPCSSCPLSPRAAFHSSIYSFSRAWTAPGDGPESMPGSQAQSWTWGTTR